MSLVFLSPETLNSGNSNAIVKSHVARLAAEKRRQARERLALECLNGAPLPADKVLVVRLPGRLPVNVGRDTLNEKVRDGKKRRLPLRQVSYHRPASPFPHISTVLSKGNSDPFNATVLVIDATANELLAFNRDHFVPWVNSMEKGKNQEASYKNKFIQHNVAAIHDNATAHASLAALAIVMANSTGNSRFRSYALELIGPAYVALREHMSSSSRRDGLAMRVFTLLMFELMAHNETAAAMHTQALQDLLSDQRRRGEPIDPHLVSAAGWMDNIRSFRFITPPIFDAEVILDPELLGEVNEFSQRLKHHGLLTAEPPALFVNTGVPPRVRKLFKQFVDLLTVGRAFEYAPQLMTDRTAISWAHSAAVLATKLKVIFHDARYQLASGGEDSQLLHREMATSLAGAFWCFAVSNFEFLDISTAEHWRHGYPSLSVSRPVLNALSYELDAIDWDGSDGAPASLKLWLLYIATLAEQALANFSGTTTGYKSKHNVRLVEHAIKMGLWSWPAVQDELGRYLYFADRGPASRPWFEKEMQEFEEGIWNGTGGVMSVSLLREPSATGGSNVMSPTTSEETFIKTPESQHHEIVFNEGQRKARISHNISHMSGDDMFGDPDLAWVEIQRLKGNPKF